MPFFEEDDQLSFELEKISKTQLTEICNSYRKKWRKNCDHLVNELQNQIAEREKCLAIENSLKNTRNTTIQTLANIGCIETSLETIRCRINTTDSDIQNKSQEKCEVLKRLKTLELENSKFNNLLQTLKSRLNLYETAFNCNLTFEYTNLFQFSYLIKDVKIGWIKFEYIPENNQFKVKDYHPVDRFPGITIQEMEKFQDTQLLLFHFWKTLV